MMTKEKMSEIIQEATKLSLEYLTANNIAFTRGDPQRFFGKVSQLHLGLSLLPTGKTITAEQIHQKNMFALWNLLVDDPIDNNGDNTALLKSISVFTGSDSTAFPPAQALLAPFSNTEYRTHTVMDLGEISMGFYYEYLINQDVTQASFNDYLIFSTQTISLLYYLDLDYASAASKEFAADYPALREAYKTFSIAIKLASDIGSFDREIETEKNLNSILILAIEEGVLTHENVFSDPEALKNNPAIQEIVERVKTMAYEKYEEAVALLAPVTSVDTTMLKLSLKQLIDAYAGGVDF